MSKAKYIIGIDLGTTNCTLSYGEMHGDNLVISQFPISQQIEQHSIDEEYHLPSFIHFPLEEEILDDFPYIVGVYAKQRGAELPQRTVASAKSWLCYDGVDRNESFLPLLEEDPDRKMSPVAACCAFLTHLKNVWDQKFPLYPFIEQQIYITVPASFDPLARQLVLKSAQNAHFPEVSLLEEPLAAFYSWIYKKGEAWREHLKVGDRLLVVDIGGGTTDFTIIMADEEEGNLKLERKAVGSHLLLGGDNIDLALAHIAKEKLENQGHTIDDWQLQSLVHSCRQVKEKLLSTNENKEVEVTILGRGSSLIGGSLRAALSSEEMQQLITAGFAPSISFNEKAQKELPSGISQISLPFARDPRITAQLASFLNLANEGEVKPHFPTVVLFNGGTMKSDLLRNQIMKQLNIWAKEHGGKEVRELADPDYDFAVSVGAAYYGLAKMGKGIRVRGGTNHSYFIGIESSAPAIPGIAASIKALCLVPFGMEEGSTEELNNQQFSLLLGEEAIFRFFSRSSPLLSNGQTAQVGAVINNPRKELVELTAIHAKLDKAEGDGKTVRVKLLSKVTELGVLELWCLAEDGRKWKLEFDTRCNKSN